jgi:hypothetical protein
MLTNVDLSREVAKAEYKRLKDDADLKLADLQRQVKALGIPVIIAFEGWSASGKGTLINRLILPLDPRGFRAPKRRLMLGQSGSTSWTRSARRIVASTPSPPFCSYGINSFFAHFFCE